MTSFRTWCGAVTGAVLFVWNSAAVAQDWPTRSMLVVSAVAGNAGIVARIVLEQVSKQISQSFVIENRRAPAGQSRASVAKPAGRQHDPVAVVVAGLLPVLQDSTSIRSAISRPVVLLASSQACWWLRRRRAGHPSPISSPRPGPGPAH
jgi:tripartite-type tricarboxylate transporter receptor subunit TctC